MMTTISYPLQDQRREHVRRLLDAFGELWPGSHYGLMHILIDDYNALDRHLEFCRGLVQSMLNGEAIYQVPEGSVVDELKASLLLLDMLALIPEEARDIHAESEEGYS